VVEPEGPSGVSKALNAAWIRPFLFLIFIVVAWDLTIRLFRIPADPVFTELVQRICKHFFTQSALD
jgi:hypothetical protein